MTPGKIKLVAQYYYDYLTQAGVIPERTNNRIERAAWCAGEIVKLIDLGELDKANRWLGFVQGVLFDQGIFDVDNLRDHSRKDSPLACLNEPVINNQKIYSEKDRRLYYQDIVYTVCTQLERIHRQKVVCGTVEEPSTQVQDLMKEMKDFFTVEA